MESRNCDCSIRQLEIKLNFIHEDLQELKALETRIVDLERGAAVTKWVSVIIASVGAFIANHKLNIF